MTAIDLWRIYKKGVCYYATIEKDSALDKTSDSIPDTLRSGLPNHNLNLKGSF